MLVATQIIFISQEVKGLHASSVGKHIEQFKMRLLILSFTLIISA